MKKKSTIFFALLFACTMAFGFGVATTVSAGPDPCCDMSFPQCDIDRGHWVGELPFQRCVKDGSSYCDETGGNCW